MVMPWAQIESRVYWAVFVVVFLAVAAWETFRPKLTLSTTVVPRWSRHGLLLIVSTVASVILYRTGPVIMAVNAAGSRFGVLNKQWSPFLVRCLLGILALDLVRYGVHRAYHSVSFLWRLHQVHHSDPDFDLSTGTRAHPLEVVITQGANLAAVAALAPPVIAVFIVELAFCAASFFGHANASMPGGLEKRLRWIFVTPDMHRIHHSEEIHEQCKNLGDIFPWWDHIFRTYLAEPAAGQQRMVVGMKGFQDKRSLGLAFMLLQPFQIYKREATHRSRFRLSPPPPEAPPTVHHR
jgi:sterol desaturase/sphingolipid hydroxylase (fatty acid hydroxylase superfamily)